MNWDGHSASQPPTTITTFLLREYYEFLFSFFFRHFEKVVKVVVVRDTTAARPPPPSQRWCVIGLVSSRETPKGTGVVAGRVSPPQPSASHGYSKGPGGDDRQDGACPYEALNANEGHP
jgi:hypothetical protein